MAFPLLAVMPVTRLDWVAILRVVVATAAELPGITYLALLSPRWLSACAEITSRWIAPVGLVLAAAALLYLCGTRRWARPLSFDFGPLDAGLLGARPFATRPFATRPFATRPFATRRFASWPPARVRSLDREVDHAAQAGQHTVDGERGQRAGLEVADQETH